jgi:CHAT domain-containing protein
MNEDPHELARRAAAILQRALAAKDTAALDQAIGLLRQSIQVVPENHPDRPMYLSNLGVGLWTRFRRTGNLADLDEAIRVGREAVDATSADHPDRPMYLSNLSGGLQSRFGRTGDLVDLEEAITVAQQAVAATPDNHAGRAVRLSNLSGGLLMRYRRTGELAHLDEAIEVGRQAVAAAPADHPDRPMYLSNLGNSLRTRFRRAGKLADLNEAIEIGRQAVAMISEHHPDRPSCLLNLSSGLRTRFEETGELGDGDEAIEVGRQAVAAISEHHPDRPMYLSNLAAALRNRFQRTGRSADLNKAIATARAAVAAIPADHPDRPMYLTILASGLRSRFERVGDLDDLDEAITANDQAVEGIPADHPNRPMYLANLGNALRSRSERTGQRADLDEAVAVGREAVDAAPPDHPDRRMYLSDLSASLMTRFLQAGQQADLDAAITAGQAALDAAPVDHPDRAGMLSNLAGGLLLRYERTGELADLDAAMTVNRAAADASPADHPDRARILLNLGSGLRSRYRRVGDPADAEAATLAWQEAAALPTAPAAIRIDAARAWGVLAASLGQWPVAVEGYAAAVHLLPLLAWRGVSRPSRERLLQDWAGLAADAAGCAVAAGQPDRAVELLEQGRGVLWSQLLETRTDLTQLQQVAPELATRLDEVRVELDRPASPTTPVAAITQASAGSAWLVDRQMTLADQWDELVDQVRALPGFEAFLRPPEIEELRRAAAGGPVVVVNVSQWRCDALLVTDTDTRVVELSAVTHDIVHHHATSYLDALQNYESTASTPATMHTAEQAITVTLEWLWDAIAQPVLTELGHEQDPDLDQAWPRVWWCPTGPLAVLPLHAAGYHDPAHKHCGDSVLDRAVSSYIPTLRALIQAHTTHPRAVSTDTHSQLLIVALRHTPGQPELPSVDRERDLLVRLFPSRHALREGPAATRQAVRHELTRHAWAHFSCHGNQYPDDPSRGGLVLYDGMLTVIDLTADQHQGEFVFLSACKTAIGGVHILDEAITQAAALQHAGWRHVIATLWSVLDIAAAEVAEDVYRRLADGGELHPQHAAEALHHAIRRQRNTSPERPSRWVPFLHHGP